MRKTILFILLFLATFLFLADRALNSSRTAEYLVPRLIERSASDIKLSVFTVGAQQFIWPGTFVFRDVELRAVRGSQALIVTSPLVIVAGMNSYISAKRAFSVQLSDARVISPPGELKGVNAQIALLLRADGFVMVEGPIQIDELVWDKFRASNATMQLIADQAKLEMRDLQLSCYGGSIGSNVKVAYAQMHYDVTARLKDLEVQKLAEVNDQFAQQISGRISGEAKAAGDALRVTSFSTDLELSGGGQVNAALLQTLTQYLPRSREKNRLDALIKMGGKLAVELFSFTIQNDAVDHLAGEIHLQSKEANLNLNLTHDIRTDGTWDGLMQYWDTIFRQ